MNKSLKAKGERGAQTIKATGEIKTVDVSLVDEWDRNPRGITEQDFERLKKQIVDLGVYKPLVVCEEAGRYIVLGGNMRLKAIKALGIKRVAISVVSARSEAERVKYALSDNDRAGYYEQEDLAEMIKGVSSEIDLSAFKVDLGEPWADLARVMNITVPPIDPKEEWKGMPEFNQGNDEGFRVIVVHLEDEAALDRFAKFVGIEITPKTKYVWYPPRERNVMKDKAFKSDR